jgi:hypothetical protein
MRQVLTLAFLLGLSGLSGPALAIALAPPPGDGPVLVLAGPWSDGAAAIIHASGGDVLGPRDTAFAAFAAPPSDDPGFAARLLSLGAFRVIDGGALAALCGVEIS